MKIIIIIIHYNDYNVTLRKKFIFTFLFYIVSEIFIDNLENFSSLEFLDKLK